MRTALDILRFLLHGGDESHARQRYTRRRQPPAPSAARRKERTR